MDKKTHTHNKRTPLQSEIMNFLPLVLYFLTIISMYCVAYLKDIKSIKQIIKVMRIVNHYVFPYSKWIAAKMYTHLLRRASMLPYDVDKQWITAKLSYNLANTYCKLGSFDQAFHYYSKVLIVPVEKKKNSHTIELKILHAHIYGNIAENFDKFKDFANSETALKNMCIESTAHDFIAYDIRLLTLLKNDDEISPDEIVKIDMSIEIANKIRKGIIKKK